MEVLNVSKKVEDAKSYIRNKFDKFKNAALTNISRCARRSSFYSKKDGYAYGFKFDFIPNIEETVDGVRIDYINKGDE